MLQISTPFFILLAVLGRTVAGPVQARAGPTVILDNATVTGIAGRGVDEFLGIPFAQPPTGNLRFQVPQPLQPYSTSFSAIAPGAGCPMQKQSGSGWKLFFEQRPTDSPFNESTDPEDCLTLHVMTPPGIEPGSKLPVVVWIYGGGFQMMTSSLLLPGLRSITKKSVELGIPTIIVSMNYRTSAYGFLASKEVKEAGVGNLGLRDQRLALRWVHKYISAFGGDPDKVTIWGQSAGAISVALHMLTNEGNPEGLFRAAFMQSGGPIPVGDITRGQIYYDDLVKETGCTGQGDTLQCLREVPFEILEHAVNESPNLSALQSLALAWLPRVDGDFLKDNPLKLVEQGRVADIPFITGSCEDEGTSFAKDSTLGIQTNEALADWLKTYWLPTAPDDTVEGVMKYYPQDPAQGSPFGTGDKFALTPQYKRIAAFMGDAVFQGPRRWFLQKKSQEQKAWTYQWSRIKLSDVGSRHGVDILAMFIGFSVWGWDLQSYMLRFAAHLDPNVGNGNGADLLYWPEYSYGPGQNETMLSFNAENKELITDTYRTDRMQYLINITLGYPL